MKRCVFAMTGALLMFAACNDKEKEYDATGTFEATETTVCAEQTGTLLVMDASEGDQLTQGQQIALVDTTQLMLRLRQTAASREVFDSQKPDAEKQIAVIRQQLAKARQEQQRYAELVADGAAPRKMLDDATSQVKVLQRQIEAQTATLHTTTQALDKQMAATDVQAQQLRDELRRCHVTAPVSGTVLEKYAEKGEFVSMGKPLLKMADTQQMYMRAYVTSAQLEKVRLGQQVTVFANYGDGQRKEYKGRVTWISDRSEFTPKTILTDDERADLVYAVKVAVNNDGFIKIGMYGELKL